MPITFFLQTPEFSEHFVYKYPVTLFDRQRLQNNDTLNNSKTQPIEHET